MPSTSPEADTAARRELLPWATPEARRALLDSEPLAALYFGELARRGLGGLRQGARTRECPPWPTGEYAEAPLRGRAGGRTS